MSLNLKKIALLIVLLSVQYWPLGCTSCGFLSDGGSRFIAEDFIIRAAEIESREDITRFSGWKEESELNFETHAFILTISESRYVRRYAYQHSNPFMYAAWACEGYYYSNQIFTEVKIYSNQAIITSEATFNAGDDLSELFTIGRNRVTSSISIDEFINLESENSPYDPNEYALIFRFNDARKIEDIENHKFYFAITLDDEKHFDIESEFISITRQSNN